MATIKDVARLAGVSPTTASYALNNRAEVKAETKERVLQAARELNYVPNKLAQSIRNGRTNTIMVVTSEDIESGSTFAPEFLGILAGARKLNYDVLVKAVSPYHMTAFDVSKLIGNSVSDGYLLLGNHLDQIAECLAKKSVPAVMLSSHTDAPILQVNTDGRSWIRKITELAYSKGKRIPAYFCFASNTKEEKLRKQGYMDAVLSVGGATLVYECGAEGEQTYNQIKQALRQGVDAAICWNDKLALQVMDILAKLNNDVLSDIAVAGFDDNQSYSNQIYQLTTVKQEFQQKGIVAIEKLVDIINGQKDLPLECFIPCSIVERHSL